MSLDGGGTAGGSGRPADHIRVAIADNRRLIVESLAALIDGMKGFEVTAACTGEEALSAAVVPRPDVLLVGVGSGPRAALELARSLRRRLPDTEIVLVADTLVPELVTFVLGEHLNGLILTRTPAAELAICLDQVAHGHAVLPANWQRVLVRDRDDPLESLSERQLEVLSLAAEGLSYQDIATRLFITSNTVKFHLRTIYLRLGVRNRAAAARLLNERAVYGRIAVMFSRT
ncbi:MAG: response regulator transcription factor [Solirubrobacterales bacterium]|nr:response regulator transcription factor [Solirubrobacterales bacterium]